MPLEGEIPAVRVIDTDSDAFERPGVPLNPPNAQPAGSSDTPPVDIPLLPYDWVTKYTDGHQQYPYTVYAIDTRYETDYGVRVLMTGAAPGATNITGQPVTHEAVRIGLKFTKKIVEFTIEREMIKPVVPDPDTQNPNEILENVELTFCCPMQQPDRKIWRAEGRYTYGLLQPLIVGQNYFPAETDDTQTEGSPVHYYGPNDFDKRFLDSRFAGS